MNLHVMNGLSRTSNLNWSHYDADLNGLSRTTNLNGSEYEYDYFGDDESLNGKKGRRRRKKRRAERRARRAARKQARRDARQVRVETRVGGRSTVAASKFAPGAGGGRLVDDIGGVLSKIKLGGGDEGGDFAEMAVVEEPKKILGMPQNVAIGAGVLLLVGGVVVATQMGKRKKRA